MTPDHEGIVSPGSAIDYIHEIKNTGTTFELIKIEVSSQSVLDNTLLLPTEFIVTEPGAYRYYQDFSVGDEIIVFDSESNNWNQVPLENDGQGSIVIPLAPGDYTNILVRVLAKTSVSYNANDVLILNASVVDGNELITNINQTVVSLTYLKVEKKGAVDSDCNSIHDTGFSASDLSARPGDCFIWQIIVKNQGAESACRVTVYDTISSFTSLYEQAHIFYEPSPGGTGTCSIDGDNIQCNVGNPIDIDGKGDLEPFCLRPGDYAEVRFGVKIK